MQSLKLYSSSLIVAVAKVSYMSCEVSQGQFQISNLVTNSYVKYISFPAITGISA